MPEEVCVRPWKFAARPFRIAGELYYVGNTYVSVHLIDTGEGLILMDTSVPQTVYLLLESIRRLGFDPDDIRYILHCHGHYDHFGGTRALVELTGAETFLGEGDVEILTERPELSWAPEYGVQFYEVFDVDHPLKGGEVISLGNTSIECVHIPGHTPGAMAYFFQVTEKGKRYNVGIMGAPGWNTLTDEYLEKYGLPRSRRTDYFNSLARVRDRKVDILIAPHPNQNDTFGKQAAMTQRSNPFIDPQAWPRFIDNLEAYGRSKTEAQ